MIGQPPLRAAGPVAKLLQVNAAAETHDVAAKGGIVSLTLPLARDLGPVGIRVVTIAPGTGVPHSRLPQRQPGQLDAYWVAAVYFPKRVSRVGEYAQPAGRSPRTFT